MKEMLYCVKHEKTVVAECLPVCGHIVFYRVLGEFTPDIDYCEFPDGWATIPPPEFDMDEYMTRVGDPPPLLEDFQTIIYDINLDCLMVENYAV